MTNENEDAQARPVTTTSENEDAQARPAPTVENDVAKRSSFRKVRRNFYILTTLTLVTLAVAAVCWFLFGPIKPTANSARLAAARDCAAHVRDVLRENRGEYRSAACLPFTGDPTDAVFFETSEALASAGTFDVKGLSFPNRLRQLAKASLSATDDTEDAVRAARRQGAEVAICGKVRTFETTAEGVELVLDYRVIDATTAREAFSGTYDSKEARRQEEEEAAAVAEANPRSAELPLIPLSGAPAASNGAASFRADGEDQGIFSDAFRSRFFALCWWTLAVLAFPILAFPFLEGIAARRSNLANFLALLLCFAVDAIFMWLLTPPTFQGAPSWLAVAAMACFATWHNVRVLHLAHRRTEPILDVDSRSA